MAQSEGLVHAIRAGQAAGAARYFAGELGSRGDYYLDREGRQGEPPGTWLGDERALRELGLEPGARVREEDLLALMEGRHPRTEARVRQPARSGAAIVAHDIHWAPPKSASLVWAYAEPELRGRIERAFEVACEVGLAELQKLPLLRGYEGGKQVGMAGGLVAARFLHHTARLAKGEHTPDPQLHAHNLLLAGRRPDGRWSALTNYHVMQNRARIDALVMGEFAFRLRELGFEIEAGEKGRWEVAGVPKELIQRNSKRHRDIEEAAGGAAEAVRASLKRGYLAECHKLGREPEAERLAEIEGFELDPVARRPLGRQTRGSKAEIPLSQDLHQQWRARDGIAEDFVRGLRRGRQQPIERGAALKGLLERLPREAGLLVERGDEVLEVRRAAASDADLMTAAARILAGQVRAAEVEELTRLALGRLVEDGRLLRVGAGRWATPAQLELERQVLESWRRGADQVAGVVDSATVAEARRSLEAERGFSLTEDQAQALELMTARGAVVAITGDAGTGKGVTAEVAVAAWERSGHRVIGLANANAIAQRLEPLGVEEAMSVHMLLHRLEKGRLELDRRTVLLLDEATMVDTALMARLERARAQAGAKLVMLGDEKQLGSISAGGLFAVATASVPHTRLQQMVRYQQPWLAEAVREQGEGRAERALELLKEHRALHWRKSAREAREEAVKLWVKARERGAGAEEVKIVVASSNRETDRLNRLIQAERLARGELGDQGVALPGRGLELRTGDLVIFREHFRQPGHARVANGTTGVVVGIDLARSSVRIRTDERQAREVIVQPERFQRQRGDRDSQQEPECGLRAAYAVHVQPGQGMTVRHAIGITDWQSGRESATVQMSRGAESFDLVVNGGSKTLELEGGEGEELLGAQLRIEKVERAASDPRLRPPLSVLERAVRDRQLSLAATWEAQRIDHERERRQREEERER